MLPHPTVIKGLICPFVSQAFRVTAVLREPRRARVCTNKTLVWNNELVAMVV